MAREYELVYILNPTIGEEEQAALNDRINNLVEANGTGSGVLMIGAIVSHTKFKILRRSII